MHLIVGLFFLGLIVIAGLMVFQLFVTLGIGIFIGFFAGLKGLLGWLWNKITFVPGEEDEEA